MGDFGIPGLLVALALLIVVCGPGRLAALGRAMISNLRARAKVRTRPDDTARPDRSG